MSKARVIALYLPQYHPIPENDEWWGKGFTEWFNVAKATPLFKGHYQPKIPTELGFYDLRLSEVREEQAKMAREAGIEGFCYWHYWFGDGKELLERPFKEVLNSGKPNFPFCLAWANHTWTSKTWNKDASRNTPLVLQEQKYPGVEDYTNHFYSVLPAFKDERYITVDGKPFFMVYDPLGFKNIKNFIDCWRKLAAENGLPGIHFVGLTYSATLRDPETGKVSYFKTTKAADNYSYVLNLGFDAVSSLGMMRANYLSKGIVKTYYGVLMHKLGIKYVNKVKQSKINQYLFVDEDKWDNVYPTLVPNFDRTARSINDIFYFDSTPEIFRQSIKDCLKLVENKPKGKNIIMLKSWNEWGEGNYVEPDIRYGRGYLDVLKDELL